MKRLLYGTAMIVSVLLVASWGWCGDYHYGASLICADCHVMHYSQEHGYNANGTGSFTSLGTTGPYKYLLRNEVNPLCLSCHNNLGWAPDVVGANTGGATRQAGALNEVGGKAWSTAAGHTLGSTDPAPGSNPEWSSEDGLNCTECHQQHGQNPNGNAYRNLDSSPGNYGDPGVIVTYAVGNNDLNKDVFETAAASYDISNVWFNEPSTLASAYANWCKGCHTDFHGAKGGGELGGADGTEWVRHPTNDANVGAHTDGHSSLAVFAGHTNKVKVMNADGVWEYVTDESELAESTPSCMSCHKAHGNQNAFGLIFMSGTGDVTEEGDDGTQAKDLCGQCHVQG